MTRFPHVNPLSRSIATSAPDGGASTSTTTSTGNAFGGANFSRPGGPEPKQKRSTARKARPRPGAPHLRRRRDRAAAGRKAENGAGARAGPRRYPALAGPPIGPPARSWGRLPRGSARPARWHARTSVEGARPSRSAVSRKPRPARTSSTPRVVSGDSRFAIRRPTLGRSRPRGGNRPAKDGPSH